jgi:hypothetical protein
MGVDALPLETDPASVRLANRAFYGLIWDEVLPVPAPPRAKTQPPGTHDN